jgi:hypothetical protein
MVERWLSARLIRSFCALAAAVRLRALFSLRNVVLDFDRSLGPWLNRQIRWAVIVRHVVLGSEIRRGVWRALPTDDLDPVGARDQALSISKRYGPEHAIAMEVCATGPQRGALRCRKWREIHRARTRRAFAAERHLPMHGNSFWSSMSTTGPQHDTCAHDTDKCPAAQAGVRSRMLMRQEISHNVVTSSPARVPISL